MESKVLLDLALKYGLSDDKVSKVVDLAYQLGIEDLEGEDFSAVARIICEKDWVEMAMEELVEVVKREKIKDKR